MLNDLHTKYAGKGLVIIGLHSDADSAEGIKAAHELKMLYPVAFDGGKVMEALGVNGFPTLVLVNKEGKIDKVDVLEEEVDSRIAKLLDQN